jgi:hypothetical protein
MFRTAVALILISTPAFADDCQEVLDAVINQAQAARHEAVFNATTGKSSEIITTSENQYIQTNGKWGRKPYNGAEVAKNKADVAINAKRTCSRVKQDIVNGQRATLYSVQTVTKLSKSESEWWISSHGMPLKMRSVTADNDTTTIYTYENIVPPV